MNTKMKQKAGNNSTNLQIAGNMNVKKSTVNLNYNLQTISEEEICKIILRVIEERLKILTNDAYLVAEQRFNSLFSKFIKRISFLNPEILNRFNEPSIQFALNDTYLRYIETGDIELGDNLIEIMIDRLEVNERTTKQFIIDEARNILPKLSIENICFLAFYTIIENDFPLKEIFTLSEFSTKLHVLFSNLNNFSVNEISYLKQIQCGGDRGFMSQFPSLNKMIEENCEIKEYLILLKSKWQSIFNLWEQYSVIHFCVYPTGKYIGCKYLEKLIGKKLPNL